MSEVVNCLVASRDVAIKDFLFLTNFLVGVAENVVAYFIIKWFDR